jgi:hypothetical protein
LFHCPAVRRDQVLVKQFEIRLAACPS